MEQLSATSIFHFKKRKLLFDVSLPVPSLTHCGKNHILLTGVNLETSQFIFDGPKENFLVYTVMI